MSTRAYSEINLHFTWHVKESLPIITEAIEPRLHRYIKSYALQAKGVIFHEIGGIETHVHIAVTIPPTLLISDWIGKLKGSSSHYVNHELVNRKLLDWQVGYGVVSFGTKDLERVINYIKGASPKRNNSRPDRTNHTMTKTMAKADSSKHAEARYLMNRGFWFVPSDPALKRWSNNPAGKPRERG
jgi:REP element-mobilizing transposase RayT